MPTVNLRRSQGRSAKPVRCARCQQPIVKGDEYYEWSLKSGRGGLLYRQHKAHGAPRQSQLTGGSMSPVYAALETAEDALKGASCMSDVEEAVNECVSELESAADDMQSSLDNMPDGLRQGSTGELLQERIDAIGECVSELQNVEFTEQDDEEPAEDGDEKTAWMDKESELVDEAKSAAQDALDSFSL